MTSNFLIITIDDWIRTRGLVSEATTLPTNCAPTTTAPLFFNTCDRFLTLQAKRSCLIKPSRPRQCTLDHRKYDKIQRFGTFPIWHICHHFCVFLRCILGHPFEFWEIVSDSSPSWALDRSFRPFFVPFGPNCQHFQKKFITFMLLNKFTATY